MIYVLFYFAVCLGAAPIVLIAINNFWLEPQNRWSQKSLTWMSILWPGTAVLLFIVFFFFGICRLAGFISDTPKSGWGRRIKYAIRDAGNAVMEPIVNRIVK